MAFDFPNAPVLDESVTTPDGITFTWDGVKWSGSVGGGAIAIADLPLSVQQMPLSFFFSGLPASLAVANISIPIPLTVPANLAGTTVSFGMWPTTANAAFDLQHNTASTSSPIGTITIDTTGGVTLAGTGGAVMPGDTLQIIMPVVQDATLADVAVTILAMRA
jgi:hypothetical protein